MPYTKETEARVVKLFSREMSLDVPAPDGDLFETGVLDSLTFVDLLVSLEEEFSIELTLDDLDIEDFRSIGKICELVEERTRGEERREAVVGSEARRWAR